MKANGPNNLDEISADLEEFHEYNIRFREKILEVQTKGAEGICTFYDKLALFSLGTIPVSFTILGSLIAANKDNVAAASLLLVCSWFLLALGSGSAAYVRYYYAREEDRVRVSVLGLESEYAKVLKSHKKLDEKVAELLVISERLDKYPLVFNRNWWLLILPAVFIGPGIFALIAFAYIQLSNLS